MAKAVKITMKSVVTEEYVKSVAAEFDVKPMIASNLYRALVAYAEEKGKKLTFAFLEKIPANEKIPRVGTTGRWLINQMILKVK